jgi:hypothetical protein
MKHMTQQFQTRIWQLIFLRLPTAPRALLVARKLATSFGLGERTIWAGDIGDIALERLPKRHV